MITIGITGTLGAGKGTVVEFFKKNGFVHYSAREFIANEVIKRGLEVNRDTLTLVGNDLRTKYSPSYVMEQLFEIAYLKNENSILESVRIVKEVEFLRKKNHFFFLAVDADLNIRYSRIIERKSETDSVSFEQFRNQEEIVESSSDPGEPNLKVCISMADKVFYNNSSIEKLNEECKAWINTIQ